METLIELLDRRPLENILGAEVFHPKRVVYICPEFAARSAALHKKMRAYFERRGQRVELIFFKADVYDADAVLALLRTILARYDDCAMDITGGTDAVLFAAGLLGAEAQIPVFTYSRYVQPEKEQLLQYPQRGLCRGPFLLPALRGRGLLPDGRGLGARGAREQRRARALSSGL